MLDFDKLTASDIALVFHVMAEKLVTRGVPRSVALRIAWNHIYELWFGKDESDCKIQ